MEVIGVCGYGYSGSGALLDYLREREECATLSGVEFNLAYMPHGLQELEWRLFGPQARYYTSDAAIKDFLRLVERVDSPNSAYRKRMSVSLERLARSFVESISQVSWQGVWSYDYLSADPLRLFLRYRVGGRILRILENRFSYSPKLPENERIFLSFAPEAYLEEAQAFLAATLRSFGIDDCRFVVLDQPFESNAPQNSMRFFENAKAIVVDRDPRDTFILVKKALKSEGSFIPTDTAEKFVSYFKMMRMGQVPDDRILRINFEDLVYDYDETRRVIDTFIGIEHEPNPRLTYFDPSVSIANTQLFDRFAECSEDVAFIADGLEDFLYDFDQWDKKPGGGVIF